MGGSLLALLSRDLGLDCHGAGAVSHSCSWQELVLTPSVGRRARRAYAPSAFDDGQESDGKDVREAMVAKVREVNGPDEETFKGISRQADEAPKLRNKLDGAMSDHAKKLGKACRRYMLARADLSGIAGMHCEAAQGLLNRSDLGPLGAAGVEGCVDDVPEGVALDKLPKASCERGSHRLLCWERLRELLEKDAAPGEDSHGPSMDEAVRKWCHPFFTLPAKGIDESLANGMPGGDADDEVDGAEDEGAASGSASAAAQS